MSTILDTNSSSISRSGKRRYLLEVEIPSRRPRPRSLRSEAPSPPSCSSTSPTTEIGKTTSTTTTRPAKKIRIPLSTESAIFPSSPLADRGKSRVRNSTRLRSQSIVPGRCSSVGPSTRIRAREAEIQAGSPIGTVSDSTAIQSDSPAGVQDNVQLRAAVDGDENDRDRMHHNANLEILAAAAHSISDDNAAMEVLAGGSVVPVSDSVDSTTTSVDIQMKEESQWDQEEEEDMSPALMEIAKDVEDHWENEDMVDTALPNHIPLKSNDHILSEEEPSECLVCTENITDLLKTADEAGKGGIGGGLALWVCDLPNCGALYCLTCAVEVANRDIQRFKIPACCACTRQWDIETLENQAKTYDPEGMVNPIPRRMPRPDGPAHLLNHQLSVIIVLVARFRATEQARGVGPDNAAPFIAWFRSLHPAAMNDELLQRAWRNYLAPHPVGLLNPRLDLPFILGSERLASEAMAEGIRAMHLNAQGRTVLRKLAEIVTAIQGDDDRDRRTAINHRVRLVAIHHSIKMRLEAVSQMHVPRPRDVRRRSGRIPADTAVDDLITRLGTIVPDPTLVDIGLIVRGRHGPFVPPPPPPPPGPVALRGRQGTIPFPGLQFFPDRRQRLDVDQMLRHDPIIRQAIAAAGERPTGRALREAVRAALVAHGHLPPRGHPQTPNAPRLANRQPRPAVVPARPQPQARPGREAGRRALIRLREMVLDEGDDA
ncbi:hypothetical protein IAR55_001134 [Kwoniella newhampshirensis]|uniref:RING-type domain-containing protein n=1 Tax=Kwoniella newhampshirensis TaxID=1651941 RepID=A0AAW0Z4U2_9TREE